MTRSVYDLSHEHKTSVDLGMLVPVSVEEVLPGDTFLHSTSCLTRVAPLAHPVMHRLELRMHHFYVPNRIAWDYTGEAGKWEDFITGKDDTTPIPTVATTNTQGNLLDHFGIPPKAGGGDVVGLPIAGYNMIWNEFYRDQHLGTERAWDDVTLARIAWQKDYFTVARPKTQQGDPVGIPVEQGALDVFTSGDRSSFLTDVQSAGNSIYSASDHPYQPTGPGNGHTAWPGLFAAATAGTQAELNINIDDLRRSMALQRFAEARMRYGERYVDYLRYIGVNPSDGRLDRPEYLGGGKDTISFSEVLQTAEGSSGGVGEMYGHGIGMVNTNGYRKMFEEHGFVYTLLSARPKTVYQNALERKFFRRTVMDYWQPELEVLPWQELRQIEVHADGDENVTFGYVPRYEEYRHGTSKVSGTFRGGTENDWHLARDFATPPLLNESFIECTPSERIFQDANMPNLLCNVKHSIRAARFVGATHQMGKGL